MTSTVLVEQKKRRKKNAQTSIEEIFQWALKELYKTAQLFTKRKSQVILETARRLEEAGVEPSTISHEIVKGLKGFVDDSYVQKVLKDYPQYKDQHQSKRAKSGRNIPAHYSQTERSLPQKQVEQLQEQRPGKWNQAPEEYDINEVDKYDLEYSHKIIRWIHQIIQSQRKRIEELEAAMTGKDSEALKSESKPKPELKLYEPPTGKMALDKWEVARWMDDKMGHCGLCQKIGEADPNRKQDRNRMFEHYYKRYGKDGYIQEVVRVDDDGKVDLYHISGGAYSLYGLPPSKLETTELKPRQNYWKTHAAPMNKIEQARKRAEEWKKEREEYEDKKSKLSPEERKALEKYETDMLFSGAKSLIKKGR